MVPVQNISTVLLSVRVYVSEYLSYVPISGPVRPDLVMANTLSTNTPHQHQHQIQRWAGLQVYQQLSCYERL